MYMVAQFPAGSFMTNLIYFSDTRKCWKPAYIKKKHFDFDFN